MPEVPELSGTAARARSAEPVEPSVTDNDQANVEAAPPIVQASTAFMVLWINGEIIITADLNAPVVVDHFPTPDEILGAAAILMADRTAERAAGLAAQSTVGLIEQKQQEAVAKAMAAREKALGEQLLAQERRG